MGLLDFLGFGQQDTFGGSTPTFFPRNSGSDYGSDFPMQSFRDDSFASFMNPLQNQLPQTQNYFSALQDMPTREDYKPSLGRNIGAALAGIAAGIGSGPTAGAQAAFQIRNAPYERAMGEYQQNISNLGKAAQGEQGLAAFAEKMAQDQFARQQGMGELGLKGAQLEQQGKLGGRELDIKEKSLTAQIAQQALERALQEKKISVEQYNAATQRLNAQTQQGEAQSKADYYKGLLGVKQNPPAPGVKPSAAYTKEQMLSYFRGDPVLNQYLKNDGSLDIEGLREDPNAAERLNQIYRKLGLQPSEDIGLR